MSKITLASLANLQNETTAVNLINSNSTIVQNAMDNTLSRDGTSPNTMGANLDMNSFQILNLPMPATANSPLRLQDLTDFTGSGTITNIPAGGASGAILKKTSAADFATGWTSDIIVDGSGTGATPFLFNVNNTNSPASPSQMGFFGVNNIGAANGAFITGAYGTSSNPVNTGASLINFLGTFDTTASKNNYTAEWHNYTISAGTGGGQYATLFQANIQGTWTPDDANLAGATATNSFAQSSRGGYLWVFNGKATATGTTKTVLNGMELDLDYRSSSTAGGQLGIQVVDISTVGTTLSTSTGYVLLAASTAYGFDTGILFSNSAGKFPITTAGTIIKAVGSATVGIGIDFSTLTITGNSFQAPSFAVSGAGAVSCSQFACNQAVNSGVNGAITGAFNLLGSTSGIVSIKPQNIAGTYNFNLPITAGSSGQPLLSGGGGSSPMTYGSLTGTGSFVLSASPALTGTIIVNENASGSPSTPVGPTGVVINLIDGGTGGHQAYSYNAQANNIVARANGTGASPSKVLNTNNIGSYFFGGFHGGSLWVTNSVGLQAVAVEDWNDSTHLGSSLKFLTTPAATGTNAEAGRFNSSGGLSVGTTTDPGIGCIQVLNNVIIGTAAKTLVLKQGANGTCGTFVCNGATPVTVSNTNIAITDTIIISLNTAGGTVGGAAKVTPMVTAITAATSFQTTGQATDTSTYNYAIIKNAA